MLSLVNIRPELERLSKKVQQLEHQAALAFPNSPSLSTGLSQNHEEMASNCHDLWSKASKIVHGLEAKLVLWSQIEQNKEDLMIWLSSTLKGLEEVVTNLDKDAARLKMSVYKVSYL